MNRIEEGMRVAVVADVACLSASQHRLLDALSQSTLPGLGVDLPGDGVPVGPRHDLIHAVGGTPEIARIAHKLWVGLVASYPAAPRELAPADCRLILSPSAAADADLLAHGARPEQLWRWAPGVDPESFGPAHYRAGVLPRESGQINVLHMGVPEQPELLELAFAAARLEEPRLALVIADASVDLPSLYASADLLVFGSSSPDFPLEILEAQASGLPVLALDGGAARELIEDGRNGVLVPGSARCLAEALVSLARRGTLRERLTVGGLSAVRGRTWERSLSQLTLAWTAAMAPADSQMMHAA
jgi:hypothetical protein